MILVGLDVFAGPAVAAAEPVEQPGVDVEADSEAEEPRSPGVRLAAVVGDLQLLGLARGGQAVGQEEDVAGPGVIVDHRQRRLERRVDVGRAPLADVIDVALGLLAGPRPVPLELRLEALDPVVVDDDVEEVVLAKVVEHRFEGLPRLLDLLARHRARPVEHEDHGLGQGLRVRRLHLGAGQQQEIAIVAGALAGSS